jgi:hypothetical protein
MNIYTYYEDIGFNNQNRLLELWRLSWEKQGFNPVVLDKSHVMKNPYYSVFVDSLDKINNELFGQDMNQYCQSCFLRWMAYTAVSDGSMLVSDYDIINGGVAKSELNNYSDKQINFLTGRCPAIAIGTPQQFSDLCYMFIDMSTANIDTLKEESKSLPAYHDQHFFSILHNNQTPFNFIHSELIHTLRHVTSKNRVNKLIHFSHLYAKKRTLAMSPNAYAPSEIENIRVNLIEEFLKTELSLTV